jgi:hypothetical protein
MLPQKKLTVANPFPRMSTNARPALRNYFFKSVKPILETPSEYLPV